MTLELAKLFSIADRVTFIAWAKNEVTVRVYVWRHNWVEIHDVSRSFWDEFSELLAMQNKRDFWYVWMGVDHRRHGHLTPASFRLDQMEMRKLIDPMAAAQQKLGDETPDSIIREILELMRNPAQSRTAHNRAVGRIINLRKVGRGA